jgi:hypothetical protein
MKKILPVIFAGLFFIFINGLVQAAVIDFQSLESNNNLENYQGYTYYEDGFTLKNLGDEAFFSPGTQSDRYGGSTALYSDQANGFIELAKTDATQFDLYSIDLAELYSNSESIPVTFVGEYFLGGTVSQTFNLDLLFTKNDFNSFETFLFSGFTGLKKVTWQQVAMYHQFDNITTDVAPVPEPSTFILLGAGLVGLVAWRKKRT